MAVLHIFPGGEIYTPTVGSVWSPVAHAFVTREPPMPALDRAVCVAVCAVGLVVIMLCAFGVLAGVWAAVRAIQGAVG